jgi:hypothetical protein
MRVIAMNGNHRAGGRRGPTVGSFEWRRGIDNSPRLDEIFGDRAVFQVPLIVSPPIAVAEHDFVFLRIMHDPKCRRILLRNSCPTVHCFAYEPTEVPTVASRDFEWKMSRSFDFVEQLYYGSTSNPRIAEDCELERPRPESHEQISRTIVGICTPNVVDPEIRVGIGVGRSLS